MSVAEPPAARGLAACRARPARPGRTPVLLLVNLVAFSSLAPQVPAPAQQPRPADTLAAPRSVTTPVPFGPGEEVRYKIKIGAFAIGEAFMRIPRIDTIRGVPAYAIEWTIDGGFPGYRIRDRFFSWVNTKTLASLRFRKETHNGTRRREIEFFPEERRWLRVDIDSAGVLPTSLPLDDVSFVYFARTLALEPGTTQRFGHFYEEEGNPIILDVLRRDRRKVGAGEFETVVIRPVIETTRLFAADSRGEIHVSDDDRRLIVYMKADLPLVNLTFHLEEVTEGVPLAARGQNPPGISVKQHRSTRRVSALRGGRSRPWEIRATLPRRRNPVRGKVPS